MRTELTSPRPWKAIREIGPDEKLYAVFIADANTNPVARLWPEKAADAALICDAVNLKARIDEAMADESGYLYPVALDGKPVVCVTPPPSEAEESRMHREYETSLLVDRERFRRCYYKAEERNGRLRDIVRRLYQMCCEDWVHTNAEGRDLLREARAAIGEDK